MVDIENNNINEFRDSNNNNLDDLKNNNETIEQMLANVSKILLTVTDIQKSTVSLSVDKQYKAYFDNYIRPMIDLIYTLTFTSQNVATMANIYRDNDYGKKNDLKKILDTSYDLLNEVQRSVKILHCYLDVLEKKSFVTLQE